MRAPASALPITFSGVSVHAGGRTILDNITMSFDSGAPTILIGPNGAGKTTLLHVAMGLLPPSRGTIEWSAQPVRAAILLQQLAMLRRSVAGNVRFALATAGVARALRSKRTDELLTMVGLSGLDSRPARRLSGGERQKLALARALARDPAILFLDEPTASLDPAASKAFEDIVRGLAASGVKIVIATQDLGQARRLGGDVMLLHRGRLIERASAEEFFTQPQSDEARRFIGGELLV